MSNNISSATLCTTDDIPTIPIYLSAINLYGGMILFTMGGLAVLIILILYVDTLWNIMRHSPSPVKTHSVFVLGVYPVVALVTFIAIIAPRAHLLAEAVTQGIFMAGMYQLFCLFLAYCGGETKLITKVKPNGLNTKVGPCCCWSFCFCLPTLEINKRNVKVLRLLVLQLPVVQGLVYMILLVMWAERESLYQVNYIYVQPVIIFSILNGIWGMSMTMRMLNELLKEHSIVGKFFVLQMVLILAKGQGLSARALLWTEWLPCRPPLTSTLYANLLYNTLMLAEMLILTIIARKLYKLPENNNNLDRICVISTIENIMKNALSSNNGATTTTT